MPPAPGEDRSRTRRAPALVTFAAMPTVPDAPGPDVSPSPPSQPLPRRPILRSFVAYLRRPRAIEPHDGTPKWWAALKLLGLDFALLIPFGAIALAAAQGIDNETFTADEGLSAGEIAIAAIILAPLLEETAFRLWLAPLRSAFLVTSGLVLLLFISGAGLSYLIVPAAALVIIGFAARPGRPDAPNERPRRQTLIGAWDARFPYVFYGSAVVFGLVHLFNYDLGVADSLDLTLAPLLIAPQLAGGFVLAYTRVRLGFWYSVANHALYNAVLTLPAVFVE
jgi:hypothetical protein